MSRPTPLATPSAASPVETATAAAIAAVVAAGRSASARGWVPATSGNFSVRIDADTIALTRSGVDKGSLTPDDVLIQPLGHPPLSRASAETPLHLALYRDRPEIGAVFHTHSPAASVLSRARLARGAIRLDGWELQKALVGVSSHEAAIEVPVFANDQDTTALAERVSQRLASTSDGLVAAPGYLLAGHGLYAWGATPQQAERHLEALEVLLAQTLTLASLPV